MPWRGPSEPGEFPTLGHEVACWIESHVVIPDGERLGQPYMLTDEQYKHLLWSYRLVPNARDGDGSDAFEYSGALLVRPQKWGKDPFAAAIICAEALGPVRFAGWNADGEPVGKPWPTPWLQCAGNAEEQTGNTFRPLLSMLREGPLANTPGLDPGETRINLPGGGRIEPVTSSSRARQGARVTFVSLTETQLMTENSGGLKLARTLKRNLGGMDGRWLEISNAWDPAERSVAQRTWEAQDRHVFLDYRQPRNPRVDLHDDDALMAELRHAYGDSAIERGGWVRLTRILRECQNPAHSEGEVRRYYTNAISVGSRDAVDMLLWAAQARPGELLEPGERVALGFHGALTNDATSLCAARLSDGRLFHLRTWERAPGETEWSTPRQDVHQAVKNAFDAYDVLCMYASPHGWQTEVNEWAGQYSSTGESKVLELWLSSEQRMDQLIERFRTAHQADDITHDGSEILTLHASGAALAAGKRRPSAEERNPGQPEHYQRVVRKSHAQSISAFTAALLAYEARGWAIERGAIAEDACPHIW
jgi:hypothetical protein